VGSESGRRWWRSGGAGDFEIAGMGSVGTSREVKFTWVMVHVRWLSRSAAGRGRTVTSGVAGEGAVR